MGDAVASSSGTKRHATEVFEKDQVQGSCSSVECGSQLKSHSFDKEVLSTEIQAEERDAVYGISVDESKVKAVLDMKKPGSKDDLQYDYFLVSIHELALWQYCPIWFKNGNSHARWDKICVKFKAYCNRGRAALFAAFTGIILLLIIIGMSITKLLKPNRINHATIAEAVGDWYFSRNITKEIELKQLVYYTVSIEATVLN
ncbi:CASP-like protein 1B1 [Senna tora]|uniref:CASP-like protein n=1 Tax=Senna tora TaxID=362788 RepID=A0A834WP70_9FABA|nr:CASP-like protein 1B1 [Senna tora]